MDSFKFPLLILIVAIVSCQCQQSIENKDQKTLPDEVVEAIENRISEGVTPSIAIAIIDSSGVHYFNFGKTSDDGNEVDENTIYEIGSITKVFTALILAKQVLYGDLKLDDKINDLFPDSINVPIIGVNEITLGSLTDHTSGLPRMPDNMAPANPNKPIADYTIELMYEFISNYQPTREVSSKYEYSNLGQGLLGHLLALNKNTSYEDLMIHEIADPLEMNDTRIVLTERMKKNLALGHSGNKVVENWEIKTLEGAGAIRSSTADMAKFISANLGYMNTSLIEAMELTHEIRHKIADRMYVAMAWHIYEGQNGNVFGHSGGTGGYRTFVGFAKETGRGVVLLSNSTIGSDDIGYYLLDPSSKLADLKFKSDTVKLPESTLEQYVGLYEFNPKFKITINKEGTRLFGYSTEYGKYELFPQNDSTFFLSADKAKVNFQFKNGVVESLTLFQGGQKLLGNKVE